VFSLSNLLTADILTPHRPSNNPLFKELKDLTKGMAQEKNLNYQDRLDTLLEMRLHEVAEQGFAMYMGNTS
jgi:hypothetical protein